MFYLFIYLLEDQRLPTCEPELVSMTLLPRTVPTRGTIDVDDWGFDVAAPVVDGGTLSGRAGVEDALEEVKAGVRLEPSRDRTVVHPDPVLLAVRRLAAAECADACREPEILVDVSLNGHQFSLYYTSLFTENGDK